jgi:post-segregation antitoxin (ccd killing protein)
MLIWKSEGRSMKADNPHQEKRSVELAIDADLLDQAEAAGLDVSALAEEAVAAAVSARVREKRAAEIIQACRAHDAYLATYGSLGEAVRAAAKDGH